MEAAGPTINMEQLLDAWQDADASDEVALREPNTRLPLTAERTARFMADHERLEKNEHYEEALWDAYHTLHDLAYAARDALNTLVMHQTGPLNRIAVQALLLKWDAADVRVNTAVQDVQRAREEVRQNYRERDVLVTKILIDRPLQQPLLEPGAPVAISVDTPTLGRRVTDEEMLLKDFGLQFSRL